MNHSSWRDLSCPIFILHCFPLICIITTCVLSDAHQDPNAQVPSFAAYYSEQPITVDGVLDEEAWQLAEVTSNFIDVRTRQPATQQSTARVVYTKTHLYVAVECMDDKMSEIHASERREDRMFQGDDFVEVHFEPMHSHTSKYAFFSNPLGTKVDAAEGPSGVFNTGWSAEWEQAAKILDDRWVFEMAIPFGIMNYVQADGQTWGINFTRKTVRLDELSFWSFNPTDYYKPRHFGHLTELNLADTEFKRNFEITPYVSSRVDYNGNTHSFFQTGLDTNFRLTPNIISSWTLNPDFGQIEADDDTIELRDTERFLSEKRLFFREGEELLNMTHRLYYSRRFSNIDTGAKLSGEWDDYKFSFLNVQGDMTHDEIRHGNTSVFRVIQNVGEKSNLAYYLNESEFEDGHSRVASSDGNIFLTDYLRFQYQASVADDRNGDGAALIKDRIDYLGYNSLVYQKYPWDIRLGYTGISKGFNPSLGFIPRRDIFGPSLETRYFVRGDDTWYKTFGIGFDTQLFENEDGQTILRDYSVFSGVLFQNDYAIEVQHDEDFHYPYDNNRTQIGGVRNSSDYWKLMRVAWGFGTFENVDYNEIILGKNVQPFERMPIRYEFVIRFEDETFKNNRYLDDETVWLNRIVFDYFFTDDMWLKTSLQHRSESIHNISVIYGWEFVKNAHWYVAYNSVNEGDDTGHSLFTKVTYTFHY